MYNNGALLTILENNYVHKKFYVSIPQALIVIFFFFTEEIHERKVLSCNFQYHKFDRCNS